MTTLDPTCRARANLGDGGRVRGEGEPRREGFPMASDKKRRKDAKAAKKQPPPPGPSRHPDGDRRRKGSGPAYRDAVAQKESLRHIGEVELPEDDGGERDEGSA